MIGELRFFTPAPRSFSFGRETHVSASQPNRSKEEMQNIAGTSSPYLQHRVLKCTPHTRGKKIENIIVVTVLYLYKYKTRYYKRITKPQVLLNSAAVTSFFRSPPAHDLPALHQSCKGAPRRLQGLDGAAERCMRRGATEERGAPAHHGSRAQQGAEGHPGGLDTA